MLRRSQQLRAAPRLLLPSAHQGSSTSSSSTPPAQTRARRGWARPLLPPNSSPPPPFRLLLPPSIRRFSSRANALRKPLHAAVSEAGAAEEPLLAVYDRLVAEGSLRADASQRRVARQLDRLAAVLKDYTPPGLQLLEQEEREREREAAKARAPQAAGGREGPPGVEPTAAAAAAPPAQGKLFPSPPPPPPVLRGMYLHGQVGTGKSLLMDLFYHHCPLPAKRRVHFHDFMLEVHARIHAWKQEALAREGRRRHVDVRPERNAIVQVARAIAKEAHLLCFDEFQVTDVADALIMSSFFGELWRLGVVVVATSNRAPDELYLDGLNRPYFLPFLALLQRQCRVLDMASEEDHRRRFRGAAEQSYFTPLDDDDGAAAAQLDAAFLALTGGSPGQPTTVPVMMGRRLAVPRAHRGVCRFSFDHLCRADVFAADYHALCARFHTLVLDGVPVLSTEKHNEARRFITLVDVLYETRTRLLMSAAAPVHALFEESCGGRVSGAAGGRDGPTPSDTTRVIEGGGGSSQGSGKGKGESEAEAALAQYVDAAQELVVPEGELASVKELAFAFQRAASRLVEMASEEYIETHAATRVREWEAEHGAGDNV